MFVASIRRKISQPDSLHKQDFQQGHNRWERYNITDANLLEPQRLANALVVDDMCTAFVLGGRTGPRAGASFYGEATRFGPIGTVYLASNLVSNAAEAMTWQLREETAILILSVVVTIQSCAQVTTPRHPNQRQLGETIGNDRAIFTAGFPRTAS